MPGAMGFVETKGFTGLIEATDAMIKEARVELVRQEQIGGSYATVIVTGDVGAVRASVEAGAEAAKRAGEFHAANVIPNMNAMAEKVLIRWEEGGGEFAPSDAIGLVEMQGFAAMVEAADAATKAAKVALADYVSLGSGYSAFVVRGDVAACRTAVDSGVASGSRVGPLVAKHVIPRPHPAIASVLPALGAKAERASEFSGTALGIIETKGFVPSVEALDRAVKAANVQPAGWQKVGSALSCVIFRGDVAACRSAVEAGAAGAKAVGQLVHSWVIPRPHEAVDQVLPLPKKH